MDGEGVVEDSHLAGLEDFGDKASDLGSDIGREYGVDGFAEELVRRDEEAIFGAGEIVEEDGIVVESEHEVGDESEEGVVPGFAGEECLLGLFEFVDVGEGACEFEEVAMGVYEGFEIGDKPAVVAVGGAEPKWEAGGLVEGTSELEDILIAVKVVRMEGGEPAIALGGWGLHAGVVVPSGAHEGTLGTWVEGEDDIGDDFRERLESFFGEGLDVGC